MESERLKRIYGATYPVESLVSHECVRGSEDLMAGLALPYLWGLTHSLHSPKKRLYTAPAIKYASTPIKKPPYVRNVTFSKNRINSNSFTSCSFRYVGSGYSAGAPVAMRLPARGERAGILR